MMRASIFARSGDDGRALDARAAMTPSLLARLRADPQPAAIAAKMAGVTDELNRNDTGKPVANRTESDRPTIWTNLIASLEKHV